MFVGKIALDNDTKAPGDLKLLDVTVSVKSALL